MTSSTISTPGPAVAPLQRVHVVFKCHLDVGYTDLADRVLDAYVDTFIPAVLELADKLVDQGRRERLVWTTGSWLVHHALERASGSALRRLEAGIAAGHLTWHAMPFTPHSEFLTRELVVAGLRVSQRLDVRFGRRTIAAKLTDVPGHTRALVPILADAGVEFLDVGVNPGVETPMVPPMFRWLDRATNAELTVLYHPQYGGFHRPCGSSAAIDVVMNGDNEGPPTSVPVISTLAAIAQRWPAADVNGSTLDAFARDIAATVPLLPVVTSEIGDSWIYGTGHDPHKVAAFRRLARLHQSWVAAGHAGEDIDRFAWELSLVGEHTWGLDTIVHLATDDYSADGLARDRLAGRYATFEASWAEQRAYLSRAVDLVAEPRAAQARAALETVRPPRRAATTWQSVDPVGPPLVVAAGGCRLTVAPASGALLGCSDGARQDLVVPASAVGEVSHHIYGSAAYAAYRDHYIKPEYQSEWWIAKAFGKYGLSHETALVERRARPLEYREIPVEEGVGVEIRSVFDPVDVPGAEGTPQQITTSYVYHASRDVLAVDVAWDGKAPTRVPEALWLTFAAPHPDALLSVGKLGQQVCAHDTVLNGGRNLHASDTGISYTDAAGVVLRHVSAADIALFSLGERRLLAGGAVAVAAGDAAHANLYNNLWGTNFPLWIEGPASFSFEVTRQA